MVAYQHPSSLGPLQRYRQATAILKHTSRATNPAWYKDPLDLDYQWHIRHDGASCIACFLDRETGQWSQALSLPDALLQDPEQRKAFITSSIRDAQIKTPKAIGVIVYLANDFATNELKTELDNPGGLDDLRESAITDPHSILEDSSQETEHNSYRILPFPAAHSAIATVVTHSHILAPLLEDIRTVSETSAHPVIAKAVSAPLIALMGLPDLITPPKGKPFVSILLYSWFTVLAFFNDKSDLMLVRTIQHKGIRRVGSLRSALAASCASLELIDPEFHVFPLAEKEDEDIEQRLRSAFPSSRTTVIHPVEESAALPDYCIEPILALTSLSRSSDTPLSHTFTVLKSEGWAFQDFLPVPLESRGIYPEHSEMRLLKAIRRSRLVLLILTLAVLGYLGNGIFSIVSKDEYKFDVSQSNISKVIVTKLTAEKQRIQYWNNMLEDRSKGWIAMEFLSRLASDNRGILIRSFTHTVRPDNTPGQSQVGILREWRITGFARQEAMEFLDRINTREGTDAFFKEIGDLTENSSYRPREGNRSITLNLRNLENSAFKLESLEEAILTDESSYPYTFDMTIVQRFESTDPMAINVSKAP